ncbi:hypothetical protein [Actinomadura craniellae]|uniref:hypothetical protein n=1 Tax=Actinomadura craniellae TaxID=2231787 RepID=UPI0018F1C62B|nr:hypothetical protein [Actinomadura craniellae]
MEERAEIRARGYLSDWARENVAKGRAEAIAETKAKVIFDVLAARGLEVPEDVRAEVSACTDLERLDAWVWMSATADSARALLDRTGMVLSREAEVLAEGWAEAKARGYLSDWARQSFAEGYAEGYAKGYAEGYAESMAENYAKGMAEAILTVLAARGLEVPEDVRAEVSACTDLDRLDVWIGVAATAESARALLG